MAVIRYLVWTVLLAALARATTECLDDHHCTVGLNLGLMNPNETLGFLVPQLCCREVQYPFTFLAHFFNISDYTVTFHLHEYYLLDVEVRTSLRAGGALLVIKFFIPSRSSHVLLAGNL